MVDDFALQIRIQFIDSQKLTQLSSEPRILKQI